MGAMEMPYPLKSTAAYLHAVAAVAASIFCLMACTPNGSNQPLLIDGGLVHEIKLAPKQTSIQQLRAALAAKSTDYRPRTEHFNPDGSPKYLNRLIFETSPYLLQHAHNPVDWYPWGDDAFVLAKMEDKPVLLSIGYSTCHWCHVMERESFEDEEIAAFINANFIAIKVDREERPDIDDIYMKAVQMFIGRGGWPMTTMLTHSREPFFGGTYFPPRDGDRGSRKGFLTILKEMKLAFEGDRQRLVDKAKQISTRLVGAAQAQRPGVVPGPESLEQAVRGLAQRFDPVWGGFGRAPKFPTPVTIELMLKYHRRTGDPQARHIALHTLTKMALGGMYDQIAGGFHRYSTDRKWLVPHFEKMLYDNAQLIPIYLDAYQLSAQPLMRRIASETANYVLREMTNPDGGFYSATDADSAVPGKKHQEEGWYFTWTPSELKATLAPDVYATFASFYGVTSAGNFEGRNILNSRETRRQFVKNTKHSEGAFNAVLSQAHAALYEKRAKRPPPLRDDKVIAAWNGLMISALAQAGFVLNEPRYVDAARRSGTFILQKMKTARGGLYRTFMDGKPRHAGVLDDYAFVILGFLDLFQVSGEQRWLREAQKLQNYLDTQHWDQQNGGYFMTGEDQEKLLSRDKPTYDGAEPSGNSIAAMNLLRLATLTADGDYRKRAEGIFSAFSFKLKRQGRGMTKMLSALDFYLDQPFEIALVTRKGADQARVQALLNSIRGHYLPNKALVVIAEADIANSEIPWLRDKRVLSGDVTVFVCTSGHCEKPTDQADELNRQLANTQKLYRDRSVAPISQ